ncbi:hypothetical protein D3C73_1145600 [compost metagenome]
MGAYHAFNPQRSVRDADFVPEFGDAVQFVRNESGHRVVLLAVRNGNAGPVQELIGPEGSIKGDGATGPDHTHSGAVVLVFEFADDLLHQVLEGDNAGGTAMLIGNNRYLQALLPEQAKQRIDTHGFRNPQWFDHQLCSGHLVALIQGDGEGLLHVEDTEDLVTVTTDNGKA